MDLETLSIRLGKDPGNYIDEYNKVLLAYSSMIDLPVENIPRIRQFINVLSPHVFRIKSEFPSVAMRHLGIAKESAIKKELVKLLVLFYHKGIVEPCEFFRLYLCHSDRLEIKIAMSACDVKCLGLFFEYLEKGNDRQKSFSLLMIAYAYENKVDGLSTTESVNGQSEEGTRCIEAISSSLFATQKLTKIAVLYFLGRIDFCVSETPRIAKEIGRAAAAKLCGRLLKSIKSRSDLRDVRILKYEVISLLKRTHGLDTQIGSHLLRLVDPTRKDLKDVIRVITESVDEDEVYKVVDRIVDMFCCEHKDDEFIAYGLNILKEFVMKFRVGDYLEGKIDFKFGKSKSVFYAHKGLMKAIKTGRSDGEKDVTYVRKRATKEEKLEKAMEGRKENRCRAVKKGRRNVAKRKISFNRKHNAKKLKKARKA